MSLVGLQEGSTASQEMDNRAVEVRSDVGLGARNTLSVGAAVGTSRFLQQQVLPVGPFSLQTTDARTRSLLVYARDEAELGRLTLAAEGQFQRGRSAAQYAWWGAEEAGAPAMSFDDRIARQLWRTKLLASYRAGSGCEVRFRARGMFGSIPDFQLLAPSDEFHDPGAGMPELDLVGTGDGYDLELLRTVGGLGFVRASLAYQQLRAVRDDIQMRYERATLLCPRLTLEGRAGRHTTFYVEGGYNDASVEADGARMPMPDASRWFGAVGFSYDGPAGWFMAPTVSVRGAVPPKQVAAPVNGELAVVEQRLPGYWLANIRFGRRFGLRGVAFVDVLNAFDRRYDRYETGLTQVGRVVRAGVTSRF
jgi:hypothetical protein